MNVLIQAGVAGSESIRLAIPITSLWDVPEQKIQSKQTGYTPKGEEQNWANGRDI